MRLAVVVTSIAVVTKPIVSTMTVVAAAISVAVSVTVMSIQKVGISLGLSLAVVDATIDTVGGDSDSVLLDDGLAEAVGDDGTGANSQGSLASLVDLSVESRGSEKGRHLMDSSLQITIVAGNSLVASDSNWDSSIGGNNVGLNSGGDGLVGDLMGGRHHMGDSVGVAKVAETGIGVASSEGVARVTGAGTAAFSSSASLLP